MTKPINIAYLILGSNINPHETLSKGYSLIQKSVSIVSKTPMFITPPFNAIKNIEPYYNQAISNKTTSNLKQLKHDILNPSENKLDHEIDKNKRCFDADIILYNNIINNSPIKVPHESLFKVPYVSYLLSLLIPENTIPGTTQTIQSLSESLNASKHPYKEVTNQHSENGQMNRVQI